MHFWSICIMLRLYSCLLITVNALDLLLMRRASATSCGSVPSTMNRRKGFAQAGPSSSSCTELSGGLALVPFDRLADATCAGSVASSPSATASGAATGVLMDLWLMLSRKTLGGIGPRVDPMFVSSLASVLLAPVM